VEEGGALEQRVAASGKRVLRPTHFPCRCTYPRAPSPRVLHPTQHRRRRSTPPYASLPPSRVPSHIHTSTSFRPSPHSSIPSLTYEWRRLSLEIVATKRFHRAYRAVDVITEPLFRSLVVEKERPHRRRLQRVPCEDNFSGEWADVSREIFAAARWNSM